LQINERGVLSGNNRKRLRERSRKLAAMFRNVDAISTLRDGNMDAPTPNIVSATISMAGGNHAFKRFDTDVCRAVTNNIFVGKSYPKVEFVDDVGTIIDVGANIGAASIYFAGLYPDARVHAFEPGPESFALLAENTAPFGNISVHEVGLFDNDKDAALFEGEYDPSTNSIGDSGLNSGRSRMVKLKDAKPFLHGLDVDGIDILKLDAEGCEVPILRALAEMISAIKVIYVEYHNDEDRRVIDDLLSRDHILSSADAIEPHRGELCYVARRAFPSESAMNQYSIKL
jgi:FkbM family methyltransferase